MSLLAVVQARKDSTRLPGKSLMEIEPGGYPMVRLVLGRAAAVVGVKNTVLAVPRRDVDTFGSCWWTTIGGDGNDVLSRFVSVARVFSEAETFIRFTADCPLLDAGFSRSVIDMHSTNGALLTYTGHALDGLDTEVFSRDALMTAHGHAQGRDREHVTSWMKRHLPSHEVRMPRLDPIRWSVDDAEGLDFARRVYAACEACRRGVSHHTNAGASIGGVDRTLVLDLHDGEGGGLQECTAADILQERVGPEWLYTS